jgi:hypothetical protein
VQEVVVHRIIPRPVIDSDIIPYVDG